ncbi:alpha/beta fold hydrolase [Vagococcus martis]|nr:alpha/beta fold hydrolase [Vagococcus martis]
MRISKQFILLMGILILILSGCRLNNSVKPLSSEEKEVDVAYSDVPTIFLHGAGGGKHSLGGMLTRFTNQEVAQKSLVLTVSKDGVVSENKALKGGHFSKDNPMVQVLFEDNRNNEWEQAAWIKAVLVFLQENYQVKTVNLVGHSMGGISEFRYLLQDGKNTTLPKVNKLVAIGSPFNEFLDTFDSQSLDDLLITGPSQRSERFILYENELDGMPKDVDVLLIAGKLSENDLSDKVVPLSSALSVNMMLMNNGNNVEHVIITGADHSGLHENKEVDEKVSHFLWYKN